MQETEMRTTVGVGWDAIPRCSVDGVGDSWSWRVRLYDHKLHGYQLRNWCI